MKRRKIRHLRRPHPSRMPSGLLRAQLVLHDLTLMMQGAQPGDPRLVHFKEAANR